ncbi:MAG: hypothetical protein M3P08_05635 [Thermoproteota archaeon]|nr:hypothetical protein [Thermoproteota archaeon]
MILKGKEDKDLLSMDTQHNGSIFGISPIVLCFASFGLEYKERSKFTSILLIVGGAMISTF